MCGLTYARAGVDLGKHRKMHEIAIAVFKEVARSLGYEIRGVGGFAPYIDLLGHKLVLHVDGVGTKTLVLRRLKAMKVAGWDCVAMNVNDVACNGARVVALSDYVAMDAANEEEFKDVVDGLAEAATKVGAPVVSGETAILPGLARGVDVVCFALAVIESDFENRARVGDVVLGLESWGLHANGYSLARKVVEDVIGSYDAVVEGVNIGSEMAKPTALYYSFLLKAVRMGYITSATHVTGGGWSKMKRVLGTSADAVLKAPKPSKLFEVLTKYGGIELEEAYRVFNMGVGLIVTCPRSRVVDVVRLAAEEGFTSWVLGEVVPGSGAVLVEAGWHRGERFEL
jgi:phosphoribosylformylglycinamidine cyclo-ligase